MVSDREPARMQRERGPYSFPRRDQPAGLLWGVENQNSASTGSNPRCLQGHKRGQGLCRSCSLLRAGKPCRAGLLISRTTGSGTAVHLPVVLPCPRRARHGSGRIDEPPLTCILSFRPKRIVLQGRDCSLPGCSDASCMLLFSLWHFLHMVYAAYILYVKTGWLSNAI